MTLLSVRQKHQRAIFRQMIGNRDAARLRNVILSDILLQYRKANGILPNFHHTLSVAEWQRHMCGTPATYVANLVTPPAVRYFPLTYDV